MPAADEKPGDTGDLFDHFGVREHPAAGIDEDELPGPRIARPCPGCGWFVDEAAQGTCPQCGATLGSAQ